MSKLHTVFNHSKFNFEDILYVKTRLQFKFKDEPAVKIELIFTPSDRDYGFAKRANNKSKWTEFVDTFNKHKALLSDGVAENLELEYLSTDYYACDVNHRTINRKAMVGNISEYDDNDYQTDDPVGAADEVILWSKMVLLGK